jgi:Family of unknown function (DUF6166)
MAMRPGLRYYVGGRTRDQKVWVGVRGPTDPRHRDLNPRNDLFNHSPDGFEYGYTGSGPAQLALAIVADHLKHNPQDVQYAIKIARLDDAIPESTDKLALRCHQAFKFAVIASLKGDSWQLTSEQVSTYLRKMADR